MARTRIFIDFWNFSLSWNERAGTTNTGEPRKCDWTRLPKILVGQAQAAISKAGLEEQLALEETRVYCSVNAKSRKDAALNNWLESFLNRQPSVQVFRRERKLVPRPIHCSACNSRIETCPECKAILKRAPEKGVDSAIVTDLFSLAWENAYDVAILLSSDADFIPAVIRLQEKGVKIVNATWLSHGHELAKQCWASIELDGLIEDLVREP